jgi:hypothetical protein
MREMGVRGLLIYCADYPCCHSIAIGAEQWPDDLRLSDIEQRFVSLRSYVPGHSESKRVEPNFAVPLEPDSRADEFGLVVPGSAANDAKIGITAPEPCRTIDWRAIVAVVPNVFDPFPDIAVHVEESKRIWPERPNWHGLQNRGTTATVAVGVSGAGLVSPRVARV